MTQKAYEIFRNYIKNVNAEELKQYLIDITEMGYDNFTEGHDNGYNDGNGELQDIWVDNLMFDCRLNK